MRLSTKQDSGDVQFPAFPAVVSETDINPECQYVLAMQFGSGGGQLIGPFEVEGKPSQITRNYPMIGHFVLQTKATDHEESQRVFIPRNGIVYMCGVQYSLHEATEATIAYFSDTFARSKSILLTERARLAQNCKYLD